MRARKQKSIETFFSSTKKAKKNQIEKAAFPIFNNDIMRLICELFITDEFNAILLLRLVSKGMWQIIEQASESLLNHYCPIIHEKLPDSSFSSSLFRLAKSDRERLQTAIFVSFLGDGPKLSAPFQANQKLLKYAELIAHKKTYFSLKENKESNIFLIMLLFNQSVHRESLELPMHLENFLLASVNAKNYEGLYLLHEVIKDYKSINLDRIIDAIYAGVANILYKDIEFIQLMELIPIDINRQIFTPAYDENHHSYVYYQPLLHHVALSGNLNLVAYLVKSGVDITQLASNGKSVIALLEDNIKDNIPERESETHQAQRLIKDYLTNVTDQNKESPRRRL